MITNTQYLVLKRIRSGDQMHWGMDMLFNLAHKELVKVACETSIELSNKGKAAMDEYEAKP
jgi:hypothetical protein